MSNKEKTHTTAPVDNSAGQTQHQVPAPSSRYAGYPEGQDRGEEPGPLNVGQNGGQFRPVNVSKHHEKSQKRDP